MNRSRRLTQPGDIEDGGVWRGTLGTRLDDGAMDVSNVQTLRARLSQDLNNVRCLQEAYSRRELALVSDQ